MNSTDALIIKNLLNLKKKKINKNDNITYLPIIPKFKVIKLCNLIDSEIEITNYLNNNYLRDHLRLMLILNNISYHYQVNNINKMNNKKTMIKKILNLYKNTIDDKLITIQYIK